MRGPAETGRAMSQQNVEVVQRLYEAWGREEVPGPLELLDPKIEYVNPEGAIEPGIRRGLPAFNAAIEKLFDGWATWKMEPEQYRGAKNQVAVTIRYQARARRSGVTIEGRESALLTLQDGKIVRYEWFHGPEDALEAMALEGSRMARANAEVVRRFVEGLISGQDDGYWQQVLADLDNDVAIDDLDISLDTERCRGHDGFGKWIADWSESWGSWRIEGVEIRPGSEDRLVALFVMLVEGRGSGIELSRRDAMVFTLSDSKITEIVYYNDQQQALEVAGLAE